AMNSSVGNNIAAHATVLRASDTVLGPMTATAPVHIALSLKLRNRQLLDQFIASAGAPGSGQRAMPPSQLENDHLPTTADADAVARFLTQAGFTNVVVAPNRLLVTAVGTAALTQSVFQTSLVQVQAANGTLGYANSTAAQIPASLQSTVLSVVGLQNV